MAGAQEPRADWADWADRAGGRTVEEQRHPAVVAGGQARHKAVVQRTAGRSIRVGLQPVQTQRLGPSEQLG